MDRPGSTTWIDQDPLSESSIGIQNGWQNLERGLLRHDKEEYSDDTHDVLVVVRIKKIDRGWSKDSIGFDSIGLI